MWRQPRRRREEMCQERDHVGSLPRQAPPALDISLWGPIGGRRQGEAGGSSCGQCEHPSGSAKCKGRRAAGGRSAEVRKKIDREVECALADRAVKPRETSSVSACSRTASSRICSASIRATSDPAPSTRILPPASPRANCTSPATTASTVSCAPLPSLSPSPSPSIAFDTALERVSFSSQSNLGRSVVIWRLTLCGSTVQAAHIMRAPALNLRPQPAHTARAIFLSSSPTALERPTLCTDQEVGIFVHMPT